MKTKNQKSRTMTKIKITREALAAAPAGGDDVEAIASPVEHYDEISRDVVVPYLGLVNKVGKLAEAFENKSGSFALGEQLIGSTVNVIPVHLLKVYTEVARDGRKLAYGEDVPRVFPSEASANEAGYVLDRTALAPNRVEEMGRIGFLVVAPPGDTGDGFLFKAGDLRLQPAQGAYRRGGYRQVYLPIFNHAYRMCMAQCIPTGRLNASQVFAHARAWTHQWRITAVLKKNTRNSWWEPKATQAELLSPDSVKWISENYAPTAA